jgi:hypothetical protein
MKWCEVGFQGGGETEIETGLQPQKKGREALEVQKQHLIRAGEEKEPAMLRELRGSPEFRINTLGRFMLKEFLRDNCLAAGSALCKMEHFP